MSLLYRAVWDDDSCEPVAVLDDEFKEWCQSKGIDPDDVPRRGRWAPTERMEIEVRRGDTEAGRALRCRLVEADAQGRTWTTTATALADHAVSTFWVDLECEDPANRPVEMAAPRLVRGLIGNGGQPSSFGMPLKLTATRLGGQRAAELADVMLDPDRRAPTVVFSPDKSVTSEVNLARADAAAETLAGVAHSFALDPAGQRVLDELLPDGFRVYAGAVRLYLPGLDVDDPDDAYRHRWIPVHLIARHPRRAASMLASRLARLQLHQQIPEAWDRLGDLLRQPSEAEIDTRAATIATSRPDLADDADVTALRQEIEDLTSQLAQSDLLRERSDRELRQQIARREAAEKHAETERWDDAAEMEDLRKERDGLQRVIRAIHVPHAGEGDGEDPHLLEVPKSVEEAVDLARQYLHLVEIPEGATNDIDSLSQTAKYAVWGSAVWHALLSLHTYAEAKLQCEPTGGFWMWCKNNNLWPTSKIAMRESDTVEHNPTFRDQRVFPVSTDVHDSGKIHMFSHLKIQTGGGDNIPRLYFYDDTDGSTRKMHVGYLGPHRNVRNTRS